MDEKGYFADFRDSLLPRVSRNDFEADLMAGNGNELRTKFRAVHSSSALAVNSFAPFRRRMSELHLPGFGAFQELAFERKFPIGLRAGGAPNLDVVLTGIDGVVGIESKLIEYLDRHRANFSAAYAEQIHDGRRKQAYFREMQRLMDQPDSYTRLDAAQLIKHAFGLARAFPDTPATLLYLFWEPANPDSSGEFAVHRQEIALFAERVAGANPHFRAMSYPELWSYLSISEPADWLVSHLATLRTRYLVTL